MNRQRTKPSPLSSSTNSYSSSSSPYWLTSPTDDITHVHESDDTTGYPNRHQRSSHRLHHPPRHPSPLCAPDRRNSPRKIDPFLVQLANDHPANRSPIPETENINAMENSAVPRSPTTPTPTTTTVGTTAEITTATLIETPPTTPTEEDEEIFDNLVDLLFELIITVYLYHRRREHRLRR